MLKIKYYLIKNRLMSKWVIAPCTKNSILYIVRMNGAGIDESIVREWVENAILHSELSLISISQSDCNHENKKSFFIELKSLEFVDYFPQRVITVMALKREVSAVSWSIEVLRDIA